MGSAIKPLLDQHDTRLVGVGLEKFGVEEFVAGKYFNGDLFVDEGKKSYQDLGFKSTGWLGLIPAILGRIARAAQSRIKGLAIEGNLQGDGFQKGGVLIVEKGGDSQLYFWEQDDLAELASNSEILEALGIEIVKAIVSVHAPINFIFGSRMTWPNMLPIRKSSRPWASKSREPFRPPSPCRNHLPVQLKTIANIS